VRLPRRLSSLAAAIVLLGASSAPDEPVGERLDGFEDVSAWSVSPAAGVEASLARADGRAGAGLRLDYDFHGHGGWAAARRKLSVELPENWEISFWVRGEGTANDLEVKLVDASGENVWWSVRRAFVPPKEWTLVRLKRRHFSFAWGPAPESERVLRRFVSLEIAVTAATGGRGWVALDELVLTPLPPSGPAGPPVLSASSSEAGFEAARAGDGDLATAWRSGGSPRDAAWISADLGFRREFGGLTLRWEPGRFARSYVVETSDDGAAWTPVREVRAGSGVRDDVSLPESEARFLRIRLVEPGGTAGYGLAELVVQPLEFSETPNAFFRAVARDAPRGTYPRSFSGEQTYWTVAGVSGDTDCALVSEDGAVEPSKGSFSVEPFLFANGRLFSWADVRMEHALEDGDLPIPTVSWRGAPVGLDVTAVVAGSPGSSSVLVRYRATNPSATPARAKLFLAVRPFQVNPPAQFLNSPGGVVRIQSLSRVGSSILVDGVPRVLAGGTPSGFGAMAFETGAIPEVLAAGRVPPDNEVTDSFGYASGALAYDLDLPPRGSLDVVVSLPVHPDSPSLLQPASLDGTAFAKTLAAVARTWRGAVDTVSFSGPPEAQDLFRTLRANVAYILAERDGAALRPGTRAYARSWIRDGAMMSAALLRMGHGDAVRAYLEWFAPFQDPDGRVPCCVDHRGADAVPENDSHGELIFAAAEHFRYTGDRKLAVAMLPHVERAVEYIDALRAKRRTDEYRTPEKLAFFGLLPESISHEGYSAKPVHSYWDDFWALAALKDAVGFARSLGREDLAAKWTQSRDELARDLHASIARVLETRGIDFVPGSADLADFDATSTTIALDPAGELGRLPEPALTNTFERYYAEFLRRRESSTWEDYTPYELRNVGAFVRLGWRDRAHEILAWFVKDRRPAGWRAWAEAVGREPRKPRFVGDIPHAWVGSDFVRAVLDMFAYERPSDAALVLGAGIPARWLEGGAEVGVRGLRTPYGILTWSARRDPRGRLHVRIAEGLRIPPGGLVLQLPGAPPRPIRKLPWGQS